MTNKNIENYRKLVAKNVEDSEVQKHLIKYYLHSKVELNYERLRPVIKEFATTHMAEISWDLMKSQIALMSAGIAGLIKFYGYLFENDIIHFDNEYHTLEEFVDGLIRSKKFLKNRLRHETLMSNVFIYINKDKYQLLDLNVQDQTLKKTMCKFLIDEMNSNVHTVSLYSFIYNFEQSLLGSNISTGFNDSTLIRQIKYYRNSVDNYHDVSNTLLKKFYIFIRKSMSSEQMRLKFPQTVELYFKRVDSFKLIYEGYKVVNYSYTKNVPDFDKWIVNPNGIEALGTVIKGDEFSKLSFAEIEDDYLKYTVKRWFLGRRLPLDTLYKSHSNIVLFLKFLFSEELNRILGVVHIFDFERNIDEDSYFSRNKIIAYIEYVRMQYANQHTRNAKFSNVRDYLTFLKDEDLYKVKESTLQELSVKKVNTLTGSKIKDEDLRRISAVLEEYEKSEAIEDQLFWIICFLLLTTKYRPNEILDLQRDCIDPDRKSIKHDSTDNEEDDTNVDDGTINKILMQNKTSGGERVDDNPSEYTLRAIEKAIEITSQNSVEAKGKSKNYVFLYRNRTGNVETFKLDRVYRKFKTVLLKAGIDSSKYTLYDCRTTYMTNLFVDAIKEGRVLEALVASGHKYPNTTFRHYIRPEIKEYFETFYGVTIGNVDELGTILMSLDELDREKPEDLRTVTVDDGIAYCFDDHEIGKDVECIMCPKSVVTVDKIPNVERRISNIDDDIRKATSLMEKQKHVKKKRLYVALLAALYTEKEVYDGRTGKVN